MIVEKELTRLIERDSKIISSGMSQGDIIVFRGRFITRSSAPKYCIKYKFDELYKNKPLNYFSCENCNLNCIFCSNIRAMRDLCNELP